MLRGSPRPSRRGTSRQRSRMLPAVQAAVGSHAGDADAAAAIEHLVRAIAANRRALLPLRSVAPELRRAVKNPWRTHGVEVDRAAVLAELPASAARSVRLDPKLAVSIATDGVLGRAQLEEGALVFTHARRPTARVEGPQDRLALLAEVLGTGRLMPDDLLSARMPASLGAFGEEIAVARGRSTSCSRSGGNWWRPSSGLSALSTACPMH